MGLVIAALGNLAEISVGVSKRVATVIANMNRESNIQNTCQKCKEFENILQMGFVHVDSNVGNN